MGSIVNPATVAYAANKAILTFTRTTQAASGNVAYTGFGFQPRALLVLAWADSNGHSIGFSDLSGTEACIALLILAANDVTAFMNNNLVYSAQLADGSLAQSAVLTSYDADGFTLTWTRTGATNAGTIYLRVLAFA